MPILNTLPYRARKLYYAGTPGCRFACPGLCATLGFQPALAKSETSVKTKYEFIKFRKTSTQYNAQ